MGPRKSDSEGINASAGIVGELNNSRDTSGERQWKSPGEAAEWSAAVETAT